MAKEYMVSVYMTTYYHEKYVRQAIESILSQKVNFDYEIVISDDASKDKTPNILKEYAAKYDFIKINLNQKNIGLSKNMFKAKSMCTGKYITVLSGDDYWIDNYKLQKQVDFLENNREYIGVATRIEARTNFNIFSDFIVPEIRKCNKVFTLENFLRGEDFPMNGMMMKNIINDNYEYFFSMPKISEYIDDITDCLLILTKGCIYISNDITVAYRRRIEENGEHNFNSINSSLVLFKKQIDLLNNLDKYFEGKYDLINRYIILIGPILAKNFLSINSVGQIKKIVDTIPQKYKRRFLILKSLFYIPRKALYVLVRHFSH